MATDIFGSSTDTPLDDFIESLSEMLESAGVPIPPEMLTMIAPALGEWIDNLSGVPGFSGMMLRSSQTGAGIAKDNKKRGIRSSTQRIVNSSIAESINAFALSVSRSMYSRDSYDPNANGGMDYDTFTAIQAASISDNGLFRLLYKALDPTGGVALANARGALFGDIVDAGLKNGDIRAYTHAKAVADGLFRGKRGENLYDSSKYAGFSESAATYLAGALTAGDDPLAGIDTRDTKQVQDKLAALRKKTQEVSDALTPLRDIYGTDIPKLLQDIEALSGQSIQTIDSARLRTMAMELGTRAAAGAYDVTDVAKGKVMVDKALGEAGYTGISSVYTEEQSIALNDRANQQKGFWFQPKERAMQANNDAVVGAFNSAAADTLNKMYAFARQRRLVSGIDDFNRIIANSSDPINTTMLFLRQNGIYGSASDIAKAGSLNVDSYREAYAASLGGNAVLAANGMLIKEDAVREASLNPFVGAEMRGKSTSEVRQLGLQALTLASLNPNIINMSEAERRNTIAEMLRDPNRQYIGATGRKQTLRELGVTANAYETDNLALLLNSFATTESGQAALATANQEYSQGRTLYQANVQKRLIESTKELASRVPTTFQQLAKMTLENKDKEGNIQGFNNAILTNISDITKQIAKETGDQQLASMVSVNLQGITAGLGEKLQKTIEDATGSQAEADFYKVYRASGKSDEEIAKMWEAEKQTRTSNAIQQSSSALYKNSSIMSSTGLKSEVYIGSLEEVGSAWEDVTKTKEYLGVQNAMANLTVLRRKGASEEDLAKAEKLVQRMQKRLGETATYKKYAHAQQAVNAQTELMASGMAPEALDKLFKSPEDFVNAMGTAVTEAYKSVDTSYENARRKEIGGLFTGELAETLDTFLGPQATAEERIQAIETQRKAKAEGTEIGADWERVLQLYDEYNDLTASAAYKTKQRKKVADADMATAILGAQINGGELSEAQKSWLTEKGLSEKDPKIQKELQNIALAGVDVNDIRYGLLDSGANNYLKSLGLSEQKTDSVMESLQKYQKWVQENNGTIGAKSLADWAKTAEGSAAVQQNGYDVMAGAIEEGARSAGVETSDFGGMGELVTIVRGILEFLTRKQDPDKPLEDKQKTSSNPSPVLDQNSVSPLRQAYDFMFRK